jgi:hypothetical protein
LREREEARRAAVGRVRAFGAVVVARIALGRCGKVADAGKKVLLF